MTGSYFPQTHLAFLSLAVPHLCDLFPFNPSATHEQANVDSCRGPVVMSRSKRDACPAVDLVFPVTYLGYDLVQSPAQCLHIVNSQEVIVELKPISILPPFF